jgi:succinate dehydrogenase/fumarate reductase flavoprotein subunit
LNQSYCCYKQTGIGFEEDSEEDMEERDLSRRSFLKGAAAVGVAGAVGTLASCASDTPKTDDTTTGDNSGVSWDMETDVLVMGAGAGGLCAGIAAARAGSKVLIIEKANEDDQGGNTRVAGNMWNIATDPAEGLKYYVAASERTIDVEYLKALVNAGRPLNEEFLPTMLDMNIIELPLFSPEFEALPGKEVIQSWQNGGTANSQLWNALRATADDEDNITSIFECPGKRLITDAKGMVIGAIAAQSGKEINIKARKGVVLATGGYEFNEFLLLNSYPGWPPCSRGTPYNTGDGILMAQKAGAQLWHMNASDSGGGAIMCPGLNFGHGAYDSDKVPANASNTRASASAQNFIHVNKYGKRFLPESREDGHGYGHREYLYFYDGVKCEWPNLPYWIIVDSVGAQRPMASGAREGSTFTWFTAYSGYTWSNDNSAEVDKGWILKADTAEELAQKITEAQKDERTDIYREGIVCEPAVLAKTIADYNNYAAAGFDPDFERTPESMVPLVPPFYAARAYPNQYNTQGGPKRNTKSQTLDAFDEPIPHLYSVGECGAGYGWVYNGGWNIAEAMITGWWAGEDVVTNEAWDA